MQKSKLWKLVGRGSRSKFGCVLWGFTRAKMRNPIWPITGWQRDQSLNAGVRLNAAVRCGEIPRLWLVRKKWRRQCVGPYDSPCSHSGPHQNGRAHIVVEPGFLHYTFFLCHTRIFDSSIIHCENCIVQFYSSTKISMKNVWLHWTPLSELLHGSQSSAWYRNIDKHPTHPSIC